MHFRYFAPGMCLSVLSHISKTTSKFSADVKSGAVARSSFDECVILYVLPVLWMTSCFPIIGHMACGVCIIYASAVLMQVVIYFHHLSQVAHCLTL